MTTRHVIEPHGTRSFRAHGIASIRCLEGQCWLTRTGDPRDYLLTAGDTFATARNETLFVQALGTASIETSARLTPLAASRASGIGNALALPVRRMCAWLASSGPFGRRKINHSSIR
ncbi:MAG: DUF2917 domain-containing protein [Actinomycetota bacterium]